MASHTHVLDPSWGTDPVPWAPGADPTMVPRLHAAVMDDCEACLGDLGEEASACTETMAVVVGIALSIAASVPPRLLPGLEGVLAFEPPMLLMIERARAAGTAFTKVEVLAAVGAMDTGDRLAVFRGCVGMMQLYVEGIKGDEPVQ